MPAISGRTGNGRFAAGVSGNPSGRKKVNPEVRAILQAAAPDAARKLAALVGDGNSKVALQAAVEILNRVYGKPVERVAAAVDTGEDLRAEVRRVLLGECQE